MFVVDKNEFNGTGNGDVCVRTDKGTLVALIYARTPREPNTEYADVVAAALNVAFCPAYTDLMVTPESLDAYLDANPPPPY
jgi:hypothetical protein